MQGGEREGQAPGHAIFAVRMSAIGDAVIATRALAHIRERGAEPVLVTSRANADVARCMTFLRYFLIVDGQEAVLHERSGTHPAGRPLAPTEWPAFPSVSFLDLQKTARSRRAGAVARAFARGAGWPLGSTQRVNKGTLRRAWFLALAWVVSFFRGQAPRTRPDWRRGLERVHDAQRAAADRLLARLPPPTNIMSVGANINAGAAGSRGPLFSAKGLVPPPVLDGVSLLPGSYVCLVPGASGFVKQWPKEHFRRLAAELGARGVPNVVVLGGEQEKPLGSYICHPFPGTGALGGRAGPRLVDATGRLSLAETFAMLEGAQFVYTGDTFAAHVADLTGTPGVVFFGATTPHFGFAPLSSELRLLYRDLSCSPCTRHGLSPCRFSNLKCLRGIEPGEAVEAFVATL